MGSSGGLRRFGANLWSGKSAHQRDFSLFLLVRRSVHCCPRPCFLFTFRFPWPCCSPVIMEEMYCFHCFFPSVLFVPPRICVRFSDKTLSCGFVSVKLVKPFIYKGFRHFFINIFCLINRRITGSWCKKSCHGSQKYLFTRKMLQELLIICKILLIKSCFWLVKRDLLPVNQNKSKLFFTAAAGNKTLSCRRFPERKLPVISK